MRYAPLYEKFSLRVRAGERLGIIGASGVGKTTLSNIILGRTIPQRGHVTWNGIPVRNIARKHTLRKKFPVGFATQNTANAFQQRWSVQECLAEAREGALDEIKQHFEALALSEHVLSQKIHELSGGQLQRIQLIRSVLNNPKLMLLDEPVSQLDGSNKKLSGVWLHRIVEEMRCTLVVVSHDEDWLRMVTGNIIAITRQQ
jgi:ABC-type dipeptide/oligopeptide/nickel transport system ATPase subunit